VTKSRSRVILEATSCLAYYVPVRLRVRLSRAVAVTMVSALASLFASGHVRGGCRACDVDLAFEVSVQPSAVTPAVRRRAEAGRQLRYR
jgi:hypothetical protein